MSSHDGAESCGDGGDEAESVVLGHGEEKVLGEGIHLHLVGNTTKTLVLQLKIITK